MALTHKINMYETDHEDSTKTMATFVVQNDGVGDSFVVTKRIVTASKTKEVILTEALAEAQAEIDAWVASLAVVGKVWNPSTNSIDAP